MPEPLVSILVPCFNNARTLAGTLESALAQDWLCREVIVVDDGSRDDSLAIARSFEARGVRVLAQTNAGAGVARNAALAAARGEYLQYLDADDFLSPEKIGAQVRRLEPFDGRRVASCRWGRFEDDPARARFEEDRVCRDLAPLEFLLLAARENRMMHTAAWLVPRRLAEAAGPWDAVRSPNDDGEYFCRVLLASEGITFTSEGRSFYRSGQKGTLSSLWSPGALEGILHSMERIRAHLLAHEDSPRVRGALADHFQRIAYAAYPAAPRVVRSAAARVCELGGSRLRPEMGQKTRWLAALIGWRMTWRLKAWLGQS